jgi:2,3-bisphosphoglycerate-independent phosphoglycerate mutase
VFKSVTETLARIKKIGVGCVVTLSGSFYAMDRFNYWNRVEKSYNTMVNSQSRYTFSNPLNAIEDSYGKGLSASDFVPTSILYEDSKTPISISDNDGVIFCNYRGDSLRALVTAFTQNDFDKFPTGQLNNVFVATMTEYGAGPNIHVAYKESIVGESLAKIISDNNMSQLHLASPEKYPYVTHYFNGCQDTLFPMSDNILIDVKIDKIQNEAKEISKKIITAIEKKSYNFIVANFSAIDVVAHTGDIKKTISTIETVDKYIGDIMESLLMNNFTAIIASDHGYSENLLDANTETINKGHSNNLVPFIVISRELEGKTGGVEQVENDLSALPVNGTLKDVAPTILKLLDIKDARGMEGRSII